MKEERSSLADVPRLEKHVKEEDHSSLPVPRLEDTVKQSQVVVVATAESFSPALSSTIPGDTPEVLIQFKVKRVLKGKYAAKAFTTRLSNEKIAGRDQVSQIVGKDWVACLSPNYLAGKSQSAPLTSAEFEARFKDIIAREKDAGHATIRDSSLATQNRSPAMKTLFGIAVLAVLLVAASPCLALTLMVPVSKEGAKH